MLINLNFILASSSLRRIQLLKDLSLNFKVIRSDVDELYNKKYSPSEIAILNSFKKAYSVAKNFKKELVAGFDTIVVVEKNIFGKPKDYNDAVNMLKILSDREHKVITGFSIVNLEKNITIKKSVETRVFFKKLDEKEIKWYLSTNEPFDKAGAYAIQGKGAFMVKRIEGSYSNVVGLPLTEFLESLKIVERLIK